MSLQSSCPASSVKIAFAPSKKAPSALALFQKALDLPPPEKCSPIAVAMSGGVDSSVAAAALAYLGYPVIGITMRLYTSKDPARKNACCAGRDIADAAGVAAHMGFTHYVLDYEKRFKAAVIDPFALSYQDGNTPIPCILCNQTVKFTDLLEQSKKLGCAALITGHYIRRTPVQNEKAASKTDVWMEKAVDADKDQSYFLFRTSMAGLSYLRFPLGGLKKEETRELAAFFGLKISEKPESQDICFVGDGHYTDVLKKLHPEGLMPGPIVDTSGKQLGTHKGISFYTIGQRRGVGISTGQPLFVVDICPQTQTVVVGPKAALLRRSIDLVDLHLLGDPDEFIQAPLKVRLRSSGAAVPAKVLIDASSKTAMVHLAQPTAGLAPGQACVFYTKDRVLGGGTIARHRPTFTRTQESLSEKNVAPTKPLATRPAA